MSSPERAAALAVAIVDGTNRATCSALAAWSRQDPVDLRNTRAAAIEAAHELILEHDRELEQDIRAEYHD